MKTATRIHCFDRLTITLQPNGVVVLDMQGYTGQSVQMYLHPHEARGIADLIYKIAADGEINR